MFDSIKKNLKGNEPVPDDCNDEEVYIQLTVSGSESVQLWINCGSGMDT